MEETSTVKRGYKKNKYEWKKKKGNVKEFSAYCYVAILSF